MGFTYQERINDIDASLEYVQSFRGSCINYQVHRNGSLYVLKMSVLKCEGSTSMARWSRHHVIREQEVLERARGLDGVVLLQEAYGFRNGRIALLKEYVEGTESHSTPITTNEGIKRKLRTTVEELHELGVSNLDIRTPENIIITPNGSGVKLIDFGLCKLKGAKYWGYRKGKRTDERDLMELCA